MTAGGALPRSRALIPAVLLAVAALLGAVGCGAGAAPGEGAGPGGATSPSAAAVDVPVAAPAGDGVTVAYEGNAQVELVSAAGRVLVDVYDPAALSAPATPQDVLLTTHAHDDHLSPGFQKDFPGEQLFVRAGTLEVPQAVVTSIPAAHSQGDPLEAEGGSDYIFVVDIGGLRVVHFGDLGQNALTAEQLEAIGSVDVAVMQFDNSFSQMDAQNKKGFALMDQVKPRLVVPTHFSAAALQEAAKRWPVLSSPKDWVTVTKDDLPAETSLLLLGEDGAFYAIQVEAAPVGW